MWNTCNITGLNNVVLFTLFIVVNNIEQILLSLNHITMLNNIFDIYELFRQHNIVQLAFLTKAIFGVLSVHVKEF